MNITLHWEVTPVTGLIRIAGGSGYHSQSFVVPIATVKG